ncbi:MAG TPA: S41 family peptidase [Candidatus Sulfomarinibacteraceae bacterium]|nr:S41 family peptidase [Candidatus Sulfomarinibacteraceae bacterium]
MAFVAGYVANDYLEQRVGIAAAANERGEFSTFWEAWSWVEKSYFGEVPPMKQVTYGAIRGALGELGDPYTVFIEPTAREQERESLRGNFGGIGAHISRNDAGEVILEPIPDNPAEDAGVRSGDMLLAVDGVPVDDSHSVEEIANRIRGEKGTTVVLTVIHPGDSTPVDIEVQRGDILIPSVSYEILSDYPTIGYLQLSRFSGESSAEVAGALDSLRRSGAQSLILDLRHNGGGLLDAAVDVADHFLDGGLIMRQKSKGEGERSYEANPGGLAVEMPLVVLIDGGTASSSEILAGALQDHERAILIGSKTFGKGSVQLVYDLSDGSSVHITSSRWLTPDGHEIDQQGLQPDISVEVSQEATDDGQDVTLDRAVEYLRNGIADGQ